MSGPQMPGGDWAVSVVLPIYYGGLSTGAIALLRRALASVHEQGFDSDYEIVIVDDGSVVPVADLADLVGRDLLKCTRFIRQTRNNGVVAALNRGIREARYPLIARIDCDDRWCPGKIEKQLAIFREDPDVTITATGMTRVDPDGKPIDSYIRPGDWRGILQFAAETGCPFPHGSVVARKDIYLALGGYAQDPQFRHCEDYELWTRWLRFFKPAMIKEALYAYTVSEGSISTTYGAEQQQAAQRIKTSFRKLNLVETLPGALQELADSLGSSLYTAGLLASIMWQFGVWVRIPRSTVEPLRSILPDCQFSIRDEISDALELAQIVGKSSQRPVDCCCRAVVP
jgi:glycosyltransferase involved in cell wall biosynthesis